MKKLKIYLDTSAISHLDAPDTPEKMNDTLKLWEEIKAGKYDVYLSETTLDELNACGQPKRNNLANFLKQIIFTEIKKSNETNNLADKIIEAGILTQKSYDDCIHIACATIAECDIIVSWNFKHLVNVKTINGIRGINIMSGYKAIDIYPPTVLIGSEE